ncbi:MAG: DoxX family membrane protein [Candidatus Hydrogenedens sp.]|nr:DoxX family membrane protein [Candidatus Hydrogenedens sp.]
MEKTLETYVPVVGRILLGTIFLLSAFNKIFNFSGVAAYMASAGMTTATPVFLAGAIVFLLAGSASLFLGYKARIGALLLIVFLIPATLIFHNFWALEGEAAQMQQIQFMKNLSIFGGLLLVLGRGAGAISIDARTAEAE